MFVLFNIVACVGFGLLLALVLTGLVGVLGMALFAPFRSRLLVGALIGLAFVLIGYHSVLFIGGLYARSYILDYSNIGTYTVTALGTDPTLSSIVDYFDIENEFAMGVYSGVSSVHHFTNLLLDVVDNYLWVHIGWVLLFMLVSIGLLACMGKTSTHRKSRLHERRNGGRLSTSHRSNHSSRRHRM